MPFMLTLGRLDEAVELSGRAVMLDPLNVTTYKNLGLQRMDLAD
jgi:hypothetical protein